MKHSKSTIYTTNFLFGNLGGLDLDLHQILDEDIKTLKVAKPVKSFIIKYKSLIF